MFEKATEIRRRYSEKADARSEAKGQKKERQRIKSELLKFGVELTKDQEQALFNPETRDN